MAASMAMLIATSTLPVHLSFQILKSMDASRNMRKLCDCKHFPSTWELLHPIEPFKWSHNTRSLRGRIVGTQRMLPRSSRRSSSTEAVDAPFLSSNMFAPPRTIQAIGCMTFCERPNKQRHTIKSWQNASFCWCKEPRSSRWRSKL